jgi:hypothetical protein
MERLLSLSVVDFELLSHEEQELFKTCPCLPNCLDLSCPDQDLNRLPDLPKCQNYGVKTAD